MGVIVLNNQHGKEVILNDFAYESLVASDLIKLFTPRTIKHVGTGDPMSICVLFGHNGIGDDIHVMPALHQKIQDGYTVTVIGKEFTRLCFESVGCTFRKASGYEADHIQENLKHYGAIYNMQMLCVEHDWYSEGNITKTRFEQAAEYLEVELPEKFNWDVAFFKRFRKNVASGGSILYALTSSAALRTYPRQVEISALPHIYNHPNIFIGGAGYIAPDFITLLGKILSASVVVSVDNGILAIALALGKPVVAVFGPTDANCVVHQFSKYRDMSNVTVLAPKQFAGCTLPCSTQKTRGFHVNGKCDYADGYSDCLTSIEPKDIFDSAITLFNNLTQQQ